jgi:hypothetical protein
VVDHCLDALDEEFRMGQVPVPFERRLILPARVDIEQTGIGNRAKIKISMLDASLNREHQARSPRRAALPGAIRAASVG